MNVSDLAFQPVRSSLYRSSELFLGYDALSEGSWANTADFAVYKQYVTSGGSGPRDTFLAVMEALHDSSIRQLCNEIMNGRRIIGVMGGHKMRRDSVEYSKVADLARRLTRNGFLLSSGGGPGAMEATHLGAAHSRSADGDLEMAIASFGGQVELPAGINGVVDEHGNVDAALVNAVHAWFKPAIEIAAQIADPGESVSLPTWNYGYEPTTPFATAIAKYFQNSVREDGLVSVGGSGLVFMEGKAGTIQEIFQDAAQNYYKTPPFKVFSPMVFMGIQYWESDYPVVPLLRKLFGNDFATHVLVTDDVDDVVRFLTGFPVHRYLPVGLACGSGGNQLSVP